MLKREKSLGTKEHEYVPRNVIIPDAKSNPNLVVNKPLRLLMSFRINYIHPFCEKKCLIHALFCGIVYSPLHVRFAPDPTHYVLVGICSLFWFELRVLIKYRFSFRARAEAA